MRIVKPSKILITSVSKKQITNVLLYDCCIGTLSYVLFGFNHRGFFAFTGIAGSIIVPILMKKAFSTSFFNKNYIIKVR
ncbi:hypothetical protein [Priestia sp. GS2]|jgi:hypothetical protein|uniref:hypothetical protein n=1 Tax=Priestia sp. GS2 TaxID=3117403 RepID=UPI002EDBAF95